MRINRFPKMALLWYAVMKHHYGLNENLARAVGYAAATYFAVLKQVRKYTVDDHKPKQRKKSNFSKKPNVRTAEPLGVLEFPFGLKLPTDGTGVWFDGKRISAAKFDSYMHNKFGDNSEVWEKYVKYAEYLAKNHDRSFWKSKWYKLWKEIRDKDWTKMIETIEI